MKARVLIVAAVLLAGPAAAQSVGEKSGVNALIGLSPSTADFVTQAGLSDRFEIETSRLAVERSDGPTKAYAEQMIADHEKTTAEMAAMVKDGKVQASLPTALDSTHQGKLDTLKGLQGDAFTRRYRADQVKAHTDAVDLFQRYAQGGDNPELKAWAARTQPALEHHLKMAQDLAR